MVRSLLVIAAAWSWGCSSSDGGAALCKGVTPPCIGLASGSSDSQVQAAFVQITDGGTIVFGTGTFNLKNGLTLATKNVTVKGQGMDVTVLDFSKQMGGSPNGIYDNRDGFTLEDLTMQNTFGDAVKIEGSTGVTFQRVHVQWQSTDLPNHGAYGLYPVQCTNVLIQDCKVEGASDSGVYVGQSNKIVVRRNTVDQNVAGIEIENSHFADVYGNTATNNTAGILVFALPNLQQVDTHNVRVYMNTITMNNFPSFAAQGDIVSQVPAGSGFLVMASDSVEVFQNTITSNQTDQASIISYFVADQNYRVSGGYYPYPTQVWMHDNTFSGGGDHPDPANPLGVALKMTPFPGGVVSTVLYDGITDTTRTSAHPNNNMDICLSANGSATFANLHADAAVGARFPNLTTDATNYTCMLTPLAPVSFPGL